MILSLSSLSRSSRLEFGILLGNGDFDHLSLVLLEPLELLLLSLLEEDILLSGVIDVLEQIDSSLLLSLPLGFLHFVLSFSLLLHELIDKFLISLLVSLSLLVILLELNDFLPSLNSLLFFNLLKGSFPGKGSLKNLLILLPLDL